MTPQDIDLKPGEHEIVKQIKAEISKSIKTLSPQLQHWLKTHLIEPRKVVLSIDPEGKTTNDLWLVTDHVGENDSSYRIVFDPVTRLYGLENTLTTGIHWYMGPYGTFSEAMNSL